MFADGSLRVRTEGEKRLVNTFENLEIKNFSDGGRIILKDIAKIQEQYDDSSVLKFVDGNPAVEIFVRRSKTNDALEISKNVKEVVENFKKNISSNLKIETYNSAAELIQDRISLLVKNGLTGLILVFINIVKSQQKIFVFSFMSFLQTEEFLASTHFKVLFVVLLC